MWLRSSSIAKRTWSTALMLCILVPDGQPQTTPKPKPAEKSRAWKMKGRSLWSRVSPVAEPPPKNQLQRVELLEKHLRCFRKDGSGEVVPLSEISALSLYEVEYQPVRDTMSEIAKLWPEAVVEGPAGVAAVVVYEIVLAPFSWVKTKHHFVHIVWNDWGRQSSLSLPMSPKDARSFLETLSEATGRQWIDLGQAAAEGRTSHFVLRMGEVIAFGRLHVLPGSYHVVLAEGEEGLGIVYVHLGNTLSPGSTIAVMTAEVIELESEGTPSVMMARDKDGTGRIAEIRLRNKLIRIPPLPEH